MLCVFSESSEQSGTQSAAPTGPCDTPGDVTIEDVSDTVIHSEGLEETQAASVLEPEIDASTHQVCHFIV